MKNRTETHSSQLEGAKIWHLRHVNKNSRFSRDPLSPHWDHAWTVKSNGGELIIVPAPEHSTGNKVISIRRFFIFLASGNHISKGNIIELIGNNYNIEDNVDHILNNLSDKSISGFNGSILHYDINYVYESGREYKDGQMVENVNVQLVSKSSIELLSKTKSTITSLSSCEPFTLTLIGFPANLCAGGTVYYMVSTRSWDGCVIEVTWRYVTQSCPSSSGGSSGNGSGSGGTGGNPPYSGGEGGGASQASSTLTALEILDATTTIHIPIDVKKFIDCFNDGKTAQSYSLTIYYDQPVKYQTDAYRFTAPHPGVTTNNPYGLPTGIVYQTVGGKTFDVGHTFIGYEKINTDGTRVTQVMGFYPGGFKVHSTGIMVNDSNHEYDVSYKKTVTAAQFNAALDKIKTENSSNKSYDLLYYNCTNSAEEAMNVAGANLPSTITSGVINNTPGNSGQVIGGLSGANNSSGNAPIGKGPC